VICNNCGNKGHRLADCQVVPNELIQRSSSIVQVYR
jgi:hypothetical protein